jgi:hypothetical protein
MSIYVMKNSNSFSNGWDAIKEIVFLTEVMNKSGEWAEE